MEEFQGDGIKTSGSWLATNRISVKVTAPEDDFFTSLHRHNGHFLTQFGGWMSIAEYEKDNTLVALRRLSPVKEYKPHWAALRQLSS